jgi:hypothetical protein
MSRQVGGVPPLHVVGAVGEPAFGANWIQMAGAVAVGFYKTADGIVHLQGQLDGTAAALSVIFTLPPGFRPTGTVLVPVVASTQSVTVAADGTVVPTAAAATQPSLDHIKFRAA